MHIAEVILHFVQAIAPGGKWWNFPLLGSLIYLGLIRDVLFSSNLYDIESDSLTSAFVQEQSKWTNKTDCTPYLYKRSLDGICNNLKAPHMGMAGRAMGRNTPLPEVGPYDKRYDVMDPNPREVAIKFMIRNEEHPFTPAPTLNLLSVGFIQFQIHDWMIHGQNFNPKDPVVIPRPEDDPLGPGFITIPRSIRHNAPRRGYENENTHWWDMSQMYGINKEQNDRIRTHKDGKLVMTEDGDHLPFGPDGLEITGIAVNWWTGMALWHNVYTREHNQVCDMLKKHNPTWDDEKLFDTARLIITALNAKIHTVDWTTNILKNQVLDLAMRANWDGFLGMYAPFIKNLVPHWFRRIFGKLNYSLSLILFGYVGGPAEFYSQPFTLTEEFTAVYRFHQLLPDFLRFRRANGKPTGEVISTKDSVFSKNKEIVESRRYEDIIATMGMEMAGAVVPHNFPAWLTNITNPLDPNGWLVDIATLDILKDRERAVPRYTAFRKVFKLPPVTSFDQINPDPKVQAVLAELYDDDVDKVDLQVGTVSEMPRPSGWGFSDTSFTLFVLMASRRLATDRFFTDDFTPKVYTKEGIQWVKDNDMKSVFLRNYPQLKNLLKGVENPFGPWRAYVTDAPTKATGLRIPGVDPLIVQKSGAEL